MTDHHREWIAMLSTMNFVVGFVFMASLSRSSASFGVIDQRNYSKTSVDSIQSFDHWLQMSKLYGKKPSRLGLANIVYLVVDRLTSRPSPYIESILVAKTRDPQTFIKRQVERLSDAGNRKSWRALHHNTSIHSWRALRLNTSSHERWEQFRNRFGKKYSNSLENDRRRVIWKTKSHFVKSHNEDFNLGRVSYAIAENMYSDWLPDEYSSLLGSALPTFLKDVTGSKASDNIDWATITTSNLTYLPNYVNWTMEGWVTPVSSQGKCASCWAFAAAGSLEGHLYNKTRTLQTLSVQNLMDCGAPADCNPCNGGIIDWAYSYVLFNGAINGETVYPYIAKPNVECRYDDVHSVSLNDLQSWVTLPVGNEAAMMLAVATIGPLAAAVDASALSFQMYSGGIYSSTECTTNVNHGVLVVGYGTSTEEQQSYWIIKNSWGSSWGINGYMMLNRDKNMCGIAMYASYPT